MNSDNSESKRGAAAPHAALSGGLLYKTDQDLAKVQERLAAFWQGEIIAAWQRLAREPELARDLDICAFLDRHETGR